MPDIVHPATRRDSWHLPFPAASSLAPRRAPAPTGSSLPSHRPRRTPESFHPVTQRRVPHQSPRAETLFPAEAECTLAPPAPVLLPEAPGKTLQPPLRAKEKKPPATGASITAFAPAPKHLPRPMMPSAQSLSIPAKHRVPSGTAPRGLSPGTPPTDNRRPAASAAWPRSQLPD